MAMIGYGFMNTGGDGYEDNPSKAMRHVGPRSMDLRYGLVPCWLLMVLGTGMVGYAVLTKEWSSAVCPELSSGFGHSVTSGLWRVCFMNSSDVEGDTEESCRSTGNPLDLSDSRWGEYIEPISYMYMHLLVTYGPYECRCID